jgi:cytochrome c peroxidase
VGTVLALAGLAGCDDGSGGADLVPTVSEAELGERLFFDTALSEPPGQSCGSCHDPGHAFTDPDKGVPTSEGVHPDRFGDRNTPTALYAAFSPRFHFDEAEGLWVGGQFLDGRAATLEKQAKAPFLNPVEMANPDAETVVEKVRQAEYAHLFEALYGPGALDDPEQAFERIAQAIAAFERTAVFAPFSSKYDAWLRGEADLTEQELRGLAVFEREDKGNCAACHPSRPAEDGTPPLFTDFTYDNLGVPRNPGSPFFENDPEFNPEGVDYVDLGLAGAVQKILDAEGVLPEGTSPEAERGKFKVSTLRNIAVTGPYMHNGVFTTLRQVVQFYNTRDVHPGRWGPAEVPENVNTDELGDLGLTDQEVDDLVAFLKTLTDGYTP